MAGKEFSRLRYFFRKASQEIFLAPPGTPCDLSRIAVSAIDEVFHNNKVFGFKKLMGC